MNIHTRAMTSAETEATMAADELIDDLLSGKYSACRLLHMDEHAGKRFEIVMCLVTDEDFFIGGE